MERKIKFLVADTAAFIENAPLQDIAENVITITEVLDEIKSKRQLRRLVVLPFDLKVQEPSPENIAYVREFSKKTGDYASLSAVDLKVVALTYQLEKENVGTEHLRKEPLMSKTVVRKPEKDALENCKLMGFYMPKEKGEKEEENEVEETEEIEEKSNALLGEEDTQEDEEESEGEDEQVNELTEDFNTLNCDEILRKHEDSDGEQDSGAEEAETDSDDDGGWITPSNIKQLKKDMGFDVKEEKPAIVACVSTDFSVQNLLKQIGLNLSALDGRVIRQSRMFVLRCYSCFKITTLMHKMFCPKCGNKTLKRCAVSIDENGQQVVHINFRKPITAKGKNVSLPLPRGGKHSRNPLLVEDQPMPQQMPSRVARTKTDALHEDYTAGYSPFVTRDVNSKSAMLRNRGHIKDWLRNHEYVNSRRGRKK
ncbi:RNA-binding protein NOB1 [Phlebotomus papatasi]|uniref:RNA-binding protein NOB1 n=1 Tax=Phlebotomus papatasi TaxID=29031 RepID=UPI002483B0AC|nr:RNA-binding protein NOB1 [Phlebotomus papatasi]